MWGSVVATFLYRLGRASFRRRWLVSGVWAVVLVAIGIGALTLSGTLSNAVSIPGTESQQAIDHLKKTFPEAHIGGGTARVVLRAPEGQDFIEFPRNQAEVTEVRAALRGAPEVMNATDPFRTRSLSRDGSLALIQVSYGKQAFELTDDDRSALVAAAHSSDLRAEIGGDAMRGAPETGATEVLGVAVAAVVLVITFGSLLAAGLPLLTALVGVGIGMGGLLTLSGFTELNTNTPVLALMIGLAVGIDYALFIVSRYRGELAGGLDHEQAAGRAVGTAGSAVVFAGLTVIVALAGLTVVGIPFLGEMGIAAAATVVIAVLIAVTLLPAILGFAGDKVRGRRSVPRPGRTAMGERWARFVGRHRVAALVLAVAGVAVLAIPAASMQLGLPNDATAARESSQHKAYELVSKGFGPGANGPLVVVVDTSAAHDPRAAVADTTKRINDLGVAAVLPAQPNRTGDTWILNVIPKTGPSDSATEDLVANIRTAAGELHGSTGATISVTGQTAANIDVSRTLSDSMLPYLALIVGLAFLLLMLVFRSVLVPLKATIGFLASVAATFGAVVAVFQWGWLTELLGVESTGPIMSMLPILLIGVLFGLAMDYQVFLVTRMREDYVHGAVHDTEPREAVVSGFAHGARVVVAAALIMTSVFAGFVFAEDSLIQSIGFALAVGVAVDAFVVRMTIVPALMSMLGRHAWWLPRWLDRLLPNVDVEGARLTSADPGSGSGEPPRERVPAGV